jgi:RNA polymerase sigma-70 factor (ECF subfamily)
VSLEHAIDERSFQVRGLGYSPARMVVADSPLTREATLERLRARMVAVARRGPFPDEAEDLAQDTLLVLTRKYAHVEAPEELVALGITILKKMQSSRWRKAKRREALGHSPLPSRGADDRDPLEDAASGGPDPEEVVRRRQRVQILVEAVERLDGRCRELLRRKLEGESFVQIAASLGRPVGTVYAWDNRCRKRLRKLLGGQLGFVLGREAP